MRLINISERGKVCFLLWTLGHGNQFYDFEYKGAPKLPTGSGKRCTPSFLGAPVKGISKAC